jgi:hypothetical protein
MYDEHSYRKPPRQPATAQAHWGETMAGKVTMERLGREEKFQSLLIPVSIKSDLQLVKNKVETNTIILNKFFIAILSSF